MIWSAKAKSLESNQAHCCMTIFQSVTKFTQVEPRGMWFCENPNKYICEFLICISEYTTTYICASRK